ncbi:hypothetical protein D3C73_1297730 [compost metagenome]
MLESFDITRPGAQNIAVKFDLLDVEEGFDFLGIVDKDMNVINIYTGFIYNSLGVNIIGLQDNDSGPEPQ